MTTEAKRRETEIVARAFMLYGLRIAAINAVIYLVFRRRGQRR